MPFLRVLFIAVALGFAWLALRPRAEEIVQALHQTSVAGLAAALLVVVTGLLATAALWLHLVARLHGPMPPVSGLAVFFVGQLGKYIPGSIWVLGAQADLARRHTVPPRVTVASGLIFLGLHVDTAALLAVFAMLSSQDPHWPEWVPWTVLVGVGLTLTPQFVRWCSRRVVGDEVALGWRDVATGLGLMAFAWCAYAGALVLLAPDRQWSAALGLGGAFAAAYAVGVVTVFAPAGLGAREGVFVVLAAPLVGTPEAAALAVLARLVHTAADLLLAGGSLILAHRLGRTRRSSSG
jgi:glycosyltransferase 2 family protein